jgi:DedD protein
VGAAVLMAAAIILVPEMLSGPDRSKTSAEQGGATQTRSSSRGDAPIKTYTIDLTQPPGTQPVVTPDDNRAPPPEEVPVPVAPSAANATPPAAATNDEGGPPLPERRDQAKPESSVETGTNATPDRASVARTTAPPAPVVEPPTRDAPRAPARPLASGAAAPTSGAWAVQLGSFSKQATAERLVGQLQAKGHEAFVMPVKTGSATLYRVRIGPLKDRASAETTLRAVQSIAPGAAIVAQP